MQVHRPVVKLLRPFKLRFILVSRECINFGWCGQRISGEVVIQNGAHARGPTSPHTRVVIARAFIPSTPPQLRSMAVGGRQKESAGGVLSGESA